MMIRQGPGFRFTMTLDEEIQRVQLVDKATQDASREIMTAIGVQVASWAVQDYQARARGQQAGGAQWKPITEGAIRTRLAARQPWKDVGSQLRALRVLEKPLLDAMRMKLPKGKTPGKKKQRGAIASQFMQDTPELRQIKIKRRGLKAKRKNMIAKELSSARIGIDTGRLVNSLVYGVDELRSVRVPKFSGEAPPRALFEMSRFSLRMGSNLSYAKHFDQLRPIFPPGFIDAQRQQKLDKVVALVMQKKVDDIMGRGRQ